MALQSNGPIKLEKRIKKPINKHMKREEADKLLHEKVEAGELISPVLPDGVKNYLIDIDGTITEDVPNEEPERMATCLPFLDALKTCNGW